MDAGAVVITFGSTLDAFAFEDAARAAGLPGRLIPLPTGISASCGLAWKLPAGADADALPALRREGVYRHESGIYHRLDA
jgi:hypothetical protein